MASLIELVLLSKGIFTSRVLSHSHGFEVETVTPKYTWSSHSLPITSIHVGCGGKYARVLTSSFDQTCKVLIVFKKYDEICIAAPVKLF